MYPTPQKQVTPPLAVYPEATYVYRRCQQMGQPLVKLAPVPVEVSQSCAMPSPMLPCLHASCHLPCHVDDHPPPNPPVGGWIWHLRGLC